MPKEPIDRFTEVHWFLSNFYPCRVKFEGLTYPSSEHAYQAAKCLHARDRRLIAKCPTAGEAKRIGRRVEAIKDWDKRRLAIMHRVVMAKFKQNKKLGRKLIETYPAKLEEGNNWGDRVWGTVDGVGKNWLGFVLMDVRKKLMGVTTSVCV